MHKDLENENRERSQIQKLKIKMTLKADFKNWLLANNWDFNMTFEKLKLFVFQV